MYPINVFACIHAGVLQLHPQLTYLVFSRSEISSPPESYKKVRPGQLQKITRQGKHYPCSSDTIKCRRIVIQKYVRLVGCLFG